jgi:hydroxyacylglutathione hydrolase
MFFQQFVLESLGHASYVVGDEKTGRALVLDPRRDVDVYFDFARSKGLRLQHAIDTHGHNDYLSGLQELVARQPIDVLGFADSGIGYDHRPVKDGEIIEMGNVRFEVMHTPGHTPEHVSLLVYDDASADEPALMLSGGALLVGDLARPDLLGGEEAAKEAATEFCHTIQEKILWQLPDHVEVWPTHVAGSLCGGNIGSRFSTTLGYERKTNAILVRVSSSEEFVDECIRLDNLPAVPPYWRRMRVQNLAGPSPLGILGEPPALQPDELADLQERGAIVVDARSVEAFAGAHVPGALNVSLSSSFPTWAGTVVPDGADVILVLEDPAELWVAAWELLRIGYPLPVGWLAGGMASWRKSGRAVSTLPLIDVHQLDRGVEKGAIHVLDVRQPTEWASGHVPGAQFITGARLPEAVDEVPADKPVAVICGSGHRSSVMASLLKHSGRERVFGVIGGMSAWEAAGYDSAKDD